MTVSQRGDPRRSIEQSSARRPAIRAGLRLRLGQTVFSDRVLDAFSHLLDDAFRVPGTRIRFGLDGLVGLIPFAGDAIAGVFSSLIVIAAWVRGAPAVLIARMLVNVALDVVIGSVPLVGDAFDIAWKANRRNFALLHRQLAAPGRYRGRDWAFLALITGILLGIVAVPLAALGFGLAWFAGLGRP